MIFTRAKNSKSDTPSRHLQPHNKITQLTGISKKSDPFLKDLKEVYDKENINPNLKENRVKSHHTKTDYQRSPKQKGPSQNKQNKTYNHQAYYAIKPAKETEQLGSNSKYNHSAELQRAHNRSKTSNRKSTEKDELLPTHFQEEYYNAKEERQSKKMRVTLKDIRKRKSVQESDQQYKHQEETKDSLNRELLGSIKKEMVRSEAEVECEKLKSQGSAQKYQSGHGQNRCCTHPQKKATHRLLETESMNIYCQKCAVSLVTKGHKMEQLNNPNTNNHNNRLSTRQEDLKEQRLDRLKDFLFNLDRLQPILKQTRGEQTQYRSISCSKYEEQRQILNNYYNRIKQQVSISYQKSLFNLKMFFDSLGEQLQKNQQMLETLKYKVSGIKEDILPNINSIVECNRIHQQQFVCVIHSYEEELKTVDFKLKSLSEFNYYTYYCNYDHNHNLLLNLRDAIAPQIIMAAIQEGQETKRRGSLSQASEEKKMDFYRLSFGKDGVDSNYNTL